MSETAVGAFASPHTKAWSKPDSWVALLVLSQLVVWTMVPWLLSISLPLDVVQDGLAWGHEWQWGYYKHPPLPPWTVEVFFNLFGDIGPFLLSQICVGLTFALVYKIGRELMPRREAAIGTVLLVGVFYFSVPTPEFNHNVAQLPVWAAMTLAYVKVLKTRALRWWIALGLFTGLGMMTKYSSAVLLATMLLHAATTPTARTVFRSPGPYLAAMVATIVLVPHLYWVIQHNYTTIGFFVARAGRAQNIWQDGLAPVNFLAAQMLDIAPAIVIAGFAGLLSLRCFPRDLGNENLRLLVFLGLGPALLTAAFSLVTGFGLRTMWAMPMWNLTGLLLVQAFCARWEKVSLRRLAAATTLVFAAMPLAYAIDTAVGPAILRLPSRTQWPDREIANRLASDWSLMTHKPLRIATGDTWISSLIAMRQAPRPSVWINGSYREAPWITPARVSGAGALVVWQIGRHGEAPPSNLASLPGFRRGGVERFGWPRSPKEKPIQIGWGIVPPSR